MRLKITDIEVIELHNIPVAPPLFKEPVRAAVRLLKVRTDNGIVGLSQIGGFMHSATIAFIQNDLAPLLKGKDPLETERLMHQILWKFNTRAHAGVWNFAVSAIDVALWDIKGKFFQCAGLAPPRSRAKVNSGLHHLWTASLFEGSTGRSGKVLGCKGESRLKIQVGRLNIRGEMDPSGAGAEHREDNPAEDEARVRAVREAVGDSVELMADANCLMKYDAALRWCKRFEPYNLMWFEEPIVHNDPGFVGGFAQTDEHTHRSRTVGELFHTVRTGKAEIRRFLEHSCPFGGWVHHGHESGRNGTGFQSSGGQWRPF